MDTRRRVDVYGGDPFRLTPAQRRRAARKDRRANQRPRAYCLIGVETTCAGATAHAAFLDGPESLEYRKR
jgi:hypothetical protein